MMRNLHPAGFIIVLSIIAIFLIGKELYNNNVKVNYEISQGDYVYRTCKIDSTRNNVVYFKDLNGNNISLNGDHSIKALSK